MVASSSSGRTRPLLMMGRCPDLFAGSGTNEMPASLHTPDLSSPLGDTMVPPLGGHERWGRNDATAGRRHWRAVWAGRTLQLAIVVLAISHAVTQPERCPAGGTMIGLTGATPQCPQEDPLPGLCGSPESQLIPLTSSFRVM
jgi:hypothetical protein